jgi:hypothetical protein
MTYSFDIVGITPILTFFNYQQEVENSPQRAKTYLPSYDCSLDAFIKSTEIIPNKPDWNWDEVVETMVKFWLENEPIIKQWKNQLQSVSNDSFLVARVANFNLLRRDFETIITY